MSETSNEDERARALLKAAADRPLTEGEVHAVFSWAKRSLGGDTWHREPGLRAFLGAYGDQNPFIPDALAGAAAEARQARRNRDAFIGAWRRSGFMVERRVVPLSALGRTIDLAPDVASRFAARNLHDPAYFYAKFLEWHLSLERMAALRAMRIVDLGAAYRGFADVCRAEAAAATIWLVDPVFAPGATERAPGLVEVGSAAGDLSAVDGGPVDLITSHNAFEHFMGEGDREALSAAAARLRHGGELLITPLFAGEVATVTLQPFSVFTCPSSPEAGEAVANAVAAEREAGARVQFNHRIISPYARQYDFSGLITRLKAAAPQLVPVLTIPQLHHDAGAAAAYAGVAVPEDLHADVLNILSLRLVCLRASS